MTQLARTTSDRSLPPTPNRNTSSHLEKVVDQSGDLFEVPTINKATFLPREWSKEGYSQLQLHTSQRSLSALKRSNATGTILIDKQNSTVSHSPSIVTSDEIKFSLLSHDGSKLARFKVVPGKDGKDPKRVVEICTGRGDRKIEEIDVTKAAGDFYFDTTFGGPSWHNDGRHLVFVGEAPPPKPSEDPYARPSPDKYRYTPDYGETFTGKKEPTLFLIALSDSPVHSRQNGSSRPRPSVHRLTFPETGGSQVNFGQPVFVPTKSESDSSPTLRLLATGYSSLGDDRKLGIVYCHNRPAKIYDITVEIKEKKGEEESSFGFETTKVESISPPNRSSRSPRVNNSSESPITAVYLSNILGGGHSSCAALHRLTHDQTSSSSSSSSWSDTQLVRPVYSPKTIDDFPGLYVDQLPFENSFLSLSSGPAITFTTAWRSRRVPIIVDLTNSKLTSLAPWPKAKEDDVVLPYLEKERELDSIGVFGTDGRSKIVAIRSGPTRFPDLVVADLEGCTDSEKVDWKVVRETSLSKEAATALSRLSSTILPLPKFLPSEIILVSPIPIDPSAPASVNLPPLIVFPHGGPRSCYSTDFNLSVACLALAGYRIALVNYPGSTGFGQEFLDRLAPQLGTLEVDATLATGHYLNTLSLASGTKGKRLLMGGSHGGWILAHLTSKYPREFDAAVLRNPVVDLPSMLSATDIPDWTYAETGVDYPFDSPPSILDPELYKKLHEISPLTKSAAVECPTLLLVGKIDRRVPPDQARQWYHALKKNIGRDGKPLDVEMMAFEREGHPITNEVEQEYVAFEQGLRFLAKYTEF